LKADEDRDRCLNIYRFAVPKIGFVLIVILNCIENRRPQHCRAGNNRRMKNIPILVNLNRYNDCPPDARGPGTTGIVANFDLL